jgi:glycosyltransferase involved in cell wall biosynthesis
MGGYGIANLNWCKYLIRAGVDVSVNAKFKPFPGTFEWEMMSPEMRLMFDRPFEEHKIGIIETTPDNFFMNKCKVKVCNTMAESDEIGKEWVSKINSMDYVIVPNDFYRRVFLNSGVVKPIKIIPHGVNINLFKRIARPKPKIFKFGSCGYLNERKGAFEMMMAFASEFDKGEKVELHLHTTDPDLWFYHNTKDPRIKITNDTWNFEQVRDFYYGLDCFVFPSRAEGIGYPPREAMSTGLPVIVMNYSGLEEIAKQDFSYPLEPDGYEKANPMREQPGNWAKINIQHLMYWMRHVYENQEEASRKGRYASDYIYDNCRWELCVKKLIHYLKEIDEMS